MYKYVKIGNEVLNVAIPENYQINDKVVLKIRDKYSINDELQMHRLSENLLYDNIFKKGKHKDKHFNINVEYLEYVNYVQSCLDWGSEQKIIATQDRKAWSDYQWDEEKETREEFIKRLEEAKLINGY